MASFESPLRRLSRIMEMHRQASQKFTIPIIGLLESEARRRAAQPRFTFAPSFLSDMAFETRGGVQPQLTPAPSFLSEVPRRGTVTLGETVTPAGQLALTRGEELRPEFLTPPGTTRDVVGQMPAAVEFGLISPLAIPQVSQAVESLPPGPREAARVGIGSLNPLTAALIGLTAGAAGPAVAARAGALGLPSAAAAGGAGEAAGLPPEALVPLEIGAGVGGGFLEPALARGATRGLSALARSPAARRALLAEAGGGRLPAEGVPPPREPPPTATGAEPLEPPVAAAAIPPEEAGLSFVAPLRPVEEVAAEVVTNTGLLGQVAARSGINPSLLRDTAVGRILTAYERQRVSMAELVDTVVASSLDVHAQPFTGRRGGVFSIAPDARIKRFPTKPGQSDVWMDVFSRPSEYALKPAQRAYVDDFLQVVGEAEEMRLAAGLKPRGRNREGWFYVPRQTRGARGIEFRRPSDPNLQRVFEEAQEGVARGVKYESDPRAVLELHLRNAYRELLDKQLSDALAPLSVKPSELLRATKPRLVADMDAAARELAAATRTRRSLTVGRGLEAVEPTAARTLRGEVTATRRAADARIKTAQAEFNRLKEPYRRAVEAARKSEIGPGNLFGKAEEHIPIASWRNRFFPREDADLLRESLASFGVSAKSANWIGRGFELVGNHIRFLSSVGDFAAPFIQGQPILARSPTAWAKATLRHYQAWFDPTVQARLIREHLPTYQRLAQNAVPIGDPEFFAALRAGQGVSAGRLLELAPKGEEVRRLFQAGGRQTFGRFQASYNTFLGASRAMLLEGAEGSWKGSNSDLFAFIRNISGGLDARALGVGPTQRGVEGTWLAFSPRLLRSTVALVADMRLGPLHPRGRAAMTTIGRYIAGVAGLYVASGLALGKSWKEIETGLNPLEGRKFLSHEFNGDWVGVGGQIRALMQIVAYTGRAAATGDVDAFTSPNVLENPLLRAWSFRGAPGINVGGGLVEFLSGGEVDVLPFDDIDSLPSLLRHLGTSALPFSAQGKMEGGQWTSTPFEIAGARTTPLLLRDAFEEETGRDWDETPSALRRELINANPNLQAIQRRQQTDLGEAAERNRAERSAQLLPGAQAVLQGLAGAGVAYNDNRSGIMARFGGKSEEVFGDLDIKPKGRDNELLDEYYNVDFMADQNKNGVPGDEEDKRIAAEQRDAILAQMSKPVRDALNNPANFFTDPQVVKVERLRDQAIDAIKEITALPKYEGLTVERSEAVDNFREELRQETARWKREGVQQGIDPDKITFRMVALWRAELDESLREIVEEAIILETRAPVEAYNVKRIDLAFQHQDVLSQFYPGFLASVLPIQAERALGDEAFERLTVR